MAATAARLLTNPLQFKDKYPCHTPIFAVNLRRIHPRSASSNEKRPLTMLITRMKDGSIEGVPRLRAAYQSVEDRLVDRAVENSTAGGFDSFNYNVIGRLLCSCDVEDKELNRLLDHLQKPLPDGEVDFWISGLDDPFLAYVVTAKRKYNSALFANLSVDAAKWKLGDKVAEKDPLWPDLVAESKMVEKLRREFINSKFNYAIKRVEKEMSCEEFEEKLYSTTSGLHERGQMYSHVVAKWLIKYGIRLFKIDVDDATKTEEL